MLVFNKLSVDRKKKMLKTKGVFLTKLERKNVIVVLYSLEGYFVDVFYRRTDLKIIQIRGFDSPKGLYKYQLDYREFGKRFMDLDLED